MWDNWNPPGWYDEHTVAKDVTFKTVARANHWVPEENAEGLVDDIRTFLGLV